ncbi:MAG: NAD-dependent epimerase/dehydratase family protein [Chitinispirillales bacterium]|jgi:nucleoside-diphosphate-sugar epimerase|nr:NAD-dependent epimerase/dehydratase family protein [Chitinispirillales bacterium]
MDILIIGGTGNISSEVTPLLIAGGHKVTILNTGRRPVPPECGHIKADRFNRQAFEKAVRGVSADVVIDFMAFTPEHCRADYETLRGKVGQFIFISSATVYQKPHVKIPITEDTPRGNPFWPYAQDKIACEEYFESVHGDDFPVTIVRPSHTFGKTWIPSPINGCGFTVAARMLGGKQFIIHDRGESLWTLTAASDFAKGFVGLVGNKDAAGEAFHITSDEALSWNDIYAELAKALGAGQINPVHIPTEFIAKVYPDARGKLMGDKSENGVFDNSKIKKFVPGFKCEKTFAVAIKESVNWFMESPERREIDIDEDKLIESIIRAFAPPCPARST